MQDSIECTCQMSSLCAKHRKFPANWWALDENKPLTGVMKDAVACHEGEFNCGVKDSNVHSRPCTEAFYAAELRIQAASALVGDDAAG